MRRFGQIALPLAVAAGLVARLWALGAHSLLLDEASVAIGARDMLRNHTALWDADSNAPFVWLIAHLIGLRGLSNPFILRLPPAIFGIASIVAVYWLAGRLFDERIAGITAILFAIHPFAVAFSRVLFADSFQLFFILLGCVAFDYFAAPSLNPSRLTFLHKRWVQLAMIFLLWGAAFLMKYNAVVPGALWLVAGVVAGRYSIGRAFVCFVTMAVGSFATLLPWPYDAPVWLFAFLNKGGSYSVVDATRFFWTKLHLVLFGMTEITLAAGVIMSFMLRGERRKPIAQTTIFIILYLVTISVLGRSFERYLLMIVPFAMMLFIGCIYNIHAHSREEGLFGRADKQKTNWPRYIVMTMRFIAIGVFLIGLRMSYSNYLNYLHNDYDHHALAEEALGFESKGSVADSPSIRAFWLLPEPIGAYYIGFSQLYSRAIRPSLDGPQADQNFFEWASAPYGRDLSGYGVLTIRRMARRWGLERILRSPLRFRDSVEAIAHPKPSIGEAPPSHPLAVDYLTSDFVRPGDLLIMQCGMTDLAEEPILEDISNENGPPLLKTLPLPRFEVLHVFRPGGESTMADTTMTRVRAGAWLMIRK